MALATIFVTLPFVVRELIPILETMDLSQVSDLRPNHMIGTCEQPVLNCCERSVAVCWQTVAWSSCCSATDTTETGKP